MSITDVVGGFVSGNIRAAVFEKYLYENIGLFNEALPESIFLQLIELDYKDDNDLLHMKNVLKAYYGEALSRYNDAFFERAVENAEPLSELIDRPWENETLTLECGEITSVEELHLAIMRAFHFPNWYGRNWDAFRDLVCLSGMRRVVLNRFETMRQRLPDDAESFLDIINAHADESCEIIVT